MTRAIALFLALVILLLAACSSAPVDRAYMAAGDETRPDLLDATQTFRGDDDLNVVVTLGAHNRSKTLYAIFTSPTGAKYQTDPLNAEKTVGQVILGLDWEAQGSGGWAAGEWTADIYVDDEREKTLTFSVNSEAVPTPGG
jgi:hypothetical protein